MGDTRQVDMQQRPAHRRPKQAETDAPASRPAPHPLLALQQSIGNAQVQRLLAQRQTATNEEEEEEEEIQAKHEVGAEGGALSPEAAASLDGLRGSGAPLEPGLRAPMEAILGASLADVRVHTSSQADALNQAMGARAFTSGSDIALRNDQSALDTRLMAHELTHVVQQRSMASPAGDALAGPEVRPAGDAYEQAADRVAEQFERDGLV